MDPALWEIINANDPGLNEEIEAIIRLDHPQRIIENVRIISRFGPVATCRLKKQQIIQTRSAENVLSLKAPRNLSPETEPVVSESLRKLPNIPLSSDVRRPSNLKLTGAGVVVGVVDWGCDFDHPNFKNRDGSTRLLALWDQRGPNRSDRRNRYGYGRTFSRRQINRVLRSRYPYRRLNYFPADADPSGTGSHGTHVMDIAAGNGLGGGPVGMAPKADLVFVHLANRGTKGLANLGDSVRILEAIDFIKRVAGDRPWVINLSIGNIGGPHDASPLVVRAMDYLLQEGPNRMIVQSAGNYYGRRTHASGRLQAGEDFPLHIIVDKADITPNELEIWYSGRDRFSVRFESPTGYISPWLGLEESCEILEQGKVVGRAYHRTDPNGDNHYDAFLYPSAPPGEWHVTIRGDHIEDGSFHAWLERDDTCPSCQTRFSKYEANNYFSTGTIANGYLPIVVGAYNGHSARKEKAHFSSIGPTRDFRDKPNLWAPGVSVLAAKSAPKGWRKNPGLLTRKSGTSMAAPYIAGKVALYLQF